MAEEARCPSCDGPPGSSPMAECIDPFHNRPAPDQGERDGLAQSLELLAVAMGHGLPYRCEPKVALDNAALLREAASRLRIAGPAQPQPREEGEARVDG